MSNKPLVLASALLLAACGADSDVEEATLSEAQGIEDATSFSKSFIPVRPAGLASDPFAAIAAQQADADTAAPRAAITYHNGPIMKDPMTVYFIWYGKWTSNSARAILPELINSLSGSSHFRINSVYTNKWGHHVTTSVRYGGGIFDNYSYGKQLRDPYVRALVQNAIDTGRFPRDKTAVYFVVATADVSERSGFCSRYCAWHTSAYMGGVSIKFGFLGNPIVQCPSMCAAQTISPNGVPGIDAMAMHLAALLDKVSTDPDENAWYVDGESGPYHKKENADLCAWRFGTTYRAPNGSLYNVTLGGRNYLLQQNWLLGAGGGRCATGY
jgi:hypothetical protein